MKETKPFIETLITGLAGAALFSLLNLPLPWMLGPLACVMLWQGMSGRQLTWPKALKSSGLITLGISFGLYFTIETVQLVGPYALPYIIITLFLITVSIINSSIVSRYIKVDRITSVFGSIPGGLTEMVIVSESLKGNAAYVMVFQTIRLLVVLFTVPFIIIYIFSAQNTGQDTLMAHTGTAFLSWNILWLLVPVLLGVRFHHLLPAGIMIIPLTVTAVMNIGPVQVPAIPEAVFLGAQLCVGVALGKNILLKDVKYAGKYGFIYAGLALLLIFISFISGFLLYSVTSMDLPTALLSTAPGGVVEMVLTASIVGADPAIVTALQLTRIILIILLVPVSLRWYFNKMAKEKAA